VCYSDKREVCAFKRYIAKMCSNAHVVGVNTQTMYHMNNMAGCNFLLTCASFLKSILLGVIHQHDLLRDMAYVSNLLREMALLGEHCILHHLFFVCE